MPQHVQPTTVQQQGWRHDAGQCLLEGSGIQVVELEFCQGRREREPKAHKSKHKYGYLVPGRPVLRHQTGSTREIGGQYDQQQHSRDWMLRPVVQMAEPEVHVRCL